MVKANIQSNKLAGVKVGNTYKNYEQYNAILSPEITIVKLSSMFGSLSLQEFEKLKEEIREPIMAQIRNLEDLFSRTTHRERLVNLERAQQNLEWALDASDREELKHYLRKAEQKFDAAKKNPADFEAGLTAQMGLSQTYNLLGKKAAAQKEHYEMLANLASSKPALDEAAEKAAENPESMLAFQKDLLYLLDRGVSSSDNILSLGKEHYCPEDRSNSDYFEIFSISQDKEKLG